MWVTTMVLHTHTIDYFLLLDTSFNYLSVCACVCGFPRLVTTRQQGIFFHPLRQPHSDLVLISVQPCGKSNKVSVSPGSYEWAFLQEAVEHLLLLGDHWSYFIECGKNKNKNIGGNCTFIQCCFVLFPSQGWIKPHHWCWVWLQDYQRSQQNG